MMEKGQWSAIIKRYEPNPQVCPDLSGKPIEFTNCVGAFAILVTGLTMGMLFLVLEYMLSPFKKKFYDMNLTRKSSLSQLHGLTRAELEAIIIKQTDELNQLYSKMNK